MLQWSGTVQVSVWRKCGLGGAEKQNDTRNLRQICAASSNGSLASRRAGWSAIVRGIGLGHVHILRSTQTHGPYNGPGSSLAARASGKVL